MINGVKDILIFVLAGLCLLVSLVMQPWSELGFKGDFPAWLNWLTKPLGLDSLFNELGKAPFALAIQDFLSKQGAAANFGDYAYSLFLFAALLVAAVAIIMIGREDGEEKLFLPVKK